MILNYGISEPKYKVTVFKANTLNNNYASETLKQKCIQCHKITVF